MLKKIAIAATAAGLGLTLAAVPAEADPGSGNAYGQGCILVRTGGEDLTVGQMWQELQDKPDNGNAVYGNPKEVADMKADKLKEPFSVHDWLELRCDNSTN